MKKEKTPRSVLICRYTLLAMSVGLYFGLGWIDGAVTAFIGYMFFSDWAWEPLWSCRS